MKTSTWSSPLNASTAALPVSPEVAPTMVARPPRAFRTWSISRAEQLHRHVLEGERRAVEELEHEEVVADLHERADRRMAERGVGRLDHAAEIGPGISPSTRRPSRLSRTSA